MFRTICYIGLTALISASAFGQTAVSSEQPAPRPSFEVADVHPSAHSTNSYMRGGVLRNGRYDLRTATMLDMISNAWGVDSEAVVGGPNWLEYDRYDIVARAPPNTKPDVVKQMLQALLTDRFNLKVHKDTRPMPAFALLPGKGKPKLKESEGEGNSECRFVPQENASGPPRYIMLACRHRTMQEFASDVRNFAFGYIDQPVQDLTHLDGKWDFDLRFTPRGMGPLGAGADTITIFEAIDKQLGLQLEPQTIPSAVIVVDSVNRVPSPNPAELSALIPPPPTEFEVAIIKPSRPDERPEGRIEHGRVDLKAFSLGDAIKIAWDLPGNADELVANMPRFAATDHFDITAKAPATPSGELDFDDLQVMLRKLLTERLNLRVHMEERQVDGYVLTAVRPKMAKADPSSRTKCKEGPGPDGKDPRIEHPVLSRLIACQNLTMAQLAEMLPTLANGYAHVDVLDKTGLTDAYDFTLSFSAIQVLKNSAIPGQPAPNGDSPSDPNGGLSLPDAVSRQLGLRLELKKRPMQVLVIDHVDEKPTDN